MNSNHIICTLIHIHTVCTLFTCTYIHTHIVPSYFHTYIHTCIQIQYNTLTDPQPFKYTSYRQAACTTADTCFSRAAPRRAPRSRRTPSEPWSTSTGPSSSPSPSPNTSTQLVPRIQRIQTHTYLHGCTLPTQTILLKLFRLHTCIHTYMQTEGKRSYINAYL